jgi:hypothetical protein
MHTLYLLLGLLASVTPSLTAIVPALSAPLVKYDGRVVPGSYIVKLHDGADKGAVMTLLGTVAGAVFEVTQQWGSDFINALAGSSIHLAYHSNLTNSSQGTSTKSPLMPSG